MIDYDKYELIEDECIEIYDTYEDENDFKGDCDYESDEEDYVEINDTYIN